MHILWSLDDTIPSDIAAEVNDKNAYNICQLEDLIDKLPDDDIKCYLLREFNVDGSRDVDSSSNLKRALYQLRARLIRTNAVEARLYVNYGGLYFTYEGSTGSGYDCRLVLRRPEATDRAVYSFVSQFNAQVDLNERRRRYVFYDVPANLLHLLDGHPDGND